MNYLLPVTDQIIYVSKRTKVLLRDCVFNYQRRNFWNEPPFMIVADEPEGTYIQLPSKLQLKVDGRPGYGHVTFAIPGYDFAWDFNDPHIAKWSSDADKKLRNGTVETMLFIVDMAYLKDINFELNLEDIRDEQVKQSNRFGFI